MAATSTQWNKVTCPEPETSLMYLGGTGVDAKFSMAILVEKTDRYTVEFWFKPDPTKSAELLSQPLTYLYVMQGQTDANAIGNVAQDTMLIYVENGELKCAPFGDASGPIGEPLVFTGINPFAVSEWQHITCIYVQQKYVKGQYLAIDIDLTNPRDDFKEKTLRPKTFAQSIYTKPEFILANQSQQYRWNVILGNRPQLDLVFFGSFKDVRIWKSVRTDAELFSFRFNQV